MSWSGFESAAASIDTVGQGYRNNPYSYGKMSSDSKPNNWESLRKRARALENEIDLKLVTFSKLGTNMKSSKPKKEDQEPLLGDNSGEVESLQSDLESLLQQLGQVNDDMGNFASGAGAGQSAAIHHTLQRHTEILQDYRQEFKKTSANIAAMVEREDLLNSVHSDISGYRTGQGKKRNQKMDSLQREMEHVRNSEQLIDEQISIALDTRESLVNQREILKAVQTKLNDLTNKFPMINNLVSKINFRKRRDTIILGLVIGLCLTFMIWYMFG